MIVLFIMYYVGDFSLPESPAVFLSAHLSFSFCSPPQKIHLVESPESPGTCLPEKWGTKRGTITKNALQSV